jgi:hypothetical protein
VPLFFSGDRCSLCLNGGWRRTSEQVKKKSRNNELFFFSIDTLRFDFEFFQWKKIVLLTLMVKVSHYI